MIYDPPALGLPSFPLEAGCSAWGVACDTIQGGQMEYRPMGPLRQ